MKKDNRETVQYILKQNLKVVAKYYLSNTNLDSETNAYWRGYYDASIAVLSLLGTQQIRMEEI